MIWLHFIDNVHTVDATWIQGCDYEHDDFCRHKMSLTTFIVVIKVPNTFLKLLKEIKERKLMTKTNCLATSGWKVKISGYSYKVYSIKNFWSECSRALTLTALILPVEEVEMLSLDDLFCMLYITVYVIQFSFISFILHQFFFIFILFIKNFYWWLIWSGERG